WSFWNPHAWHVVLLHGQRSRIICQSFLGSFGPCGKHVTRGPLPPAEFYCSLPTLEKSPRHVHGLHWNSDVISSPGHYPIRIYSPPPLYERSGDRSFNRHWLFCRPCLRMGTLRSPFGQRR